MRKKLLSIILSLAMVLTMIPMTGSVAFADTVLPAPSVYDWDGMTAKWTGVDSDGGDMYMLQLYKKGPGEDEAVGDKIIKAKTGNDKDETYSFDFTDMINAEGPGIYYFEVSLHAESGMGYLSSPTSRGWERAFGELPKAQTPENVNWRPGIGLTWDSVDGVAQYSIQVFRDAECSETVGTAYGRSTNILEYTSLESLPEGEYYIKLSTIGNGYSNVDSNPAVYGPIAIHNYKKYDVFVGDIQITEANKDDIVGTMQALGNDKVSGSVQWDDETNTLTLNNFKYEGEGYQQGSYYYGICINKENASIVVNGDCKITVANTKDTFDRGIAGRALYDPIVFSGDGTLDVYGRNTAFLGTVIVNGPDLIFRTKAAALMGETTEEAFSEVLEGSLTMISSGTGETFGVVAAKSKVKVNDKNIVYKGNTADDAVLVESGNYQGTGAELFGTNKYVKIYTPACSIRGHLFTNYVTTKAATCTTDGIKKAVCDRKGCEAEDTKTIPRVTTVELGTTKDTYNGSVKSPLLTVKDSDGNALVKDTDYTVVVPSGRKNVGTYTYKVNFKGNYSGTESVSFKINPATPSIKSITSGKKNMTVKMTTKPSSKGASTYQIQYKQKGTSKWKSATTTSASKTIKRLKKGKQYYVKVRAYKKVGTTTYYGAWSKTKLSKKIK